MNTYEQIADDLDGAADYIEKHGWTRGTPVDELGRVCLIGGINAVTIGCPAYRATDSVTERRRIIDLLNGPRRTRAVTAVSRTVGHPAAWNDTNGRTEQEVLDLLRTTAKEHRILADTQKGKQHDSDT
jgi:hypothetical protein